MIGRYPEIIFWEFLHFFPTGKGIWKDLLKSLGQFSIRWKEFMKGFKAVFHMVKRVYESATCSKPFKGLRTLLTLS